MLPFGAMPAGAFLVTATSAETETVALEVALAWPGVGESIVAVFAIVLPFGAEGNTVSVRVKVADGPVGQGAMWQRTEPVPPTAGVVHDQPAGAATDVNVVFGGRSSLRSPIEASDGPLLVATMV